MNWDTGQSSGTAMRLWLGTIDFEHFADEMGYEEEEQHREESRALCLRSARAVAMADGSPEQTEGDVLKTWVQETIAPFSEEKQKELKDLYNDAMRKAYAEATEGTLTLSESTARLNEIGERKRKLPEGGGRGSKRCREGPAQEAKATEMERHR